MACKIKYAGLGDITVHKGYESLEITCKLRIKIPEKALGTKIPPVSYFWAAPLHLSVHTEGASWDRVPVRSPGLPAAWHTV